MCIRLNLYYKTSPHRSCSLCYTATTTASETSSSLWRRRRASSARAAWRPKKRSTKKKHKLFEKTCHAAVMHKKLLTFCLSHVVSFSMIHPRLSIFCGYSRWLPIFSRFSPVLKISKFEVWKFDHFDHFEGEIGWDWLRLVEICGALWSS